MYYVVCLRYLDGVFFVLVQNSVRSVWEKKVNFLFLQVVLPFGEKVE